jgi:transposase
MNDIYDVCCGLDVHKESIVACIIKTSKEPSKSNNEDNVDIEIRTFKTFFNDLIELRKWIEEENCHHVAMESTGIYWCPIYDELEKAFQGNIEILVTNARDMRTVPGKKTDIKDSQWIASLLRAGLLYGSFIPPVDIRELRLLTRYRKNIVEDINTQKNRIEKFLQGSGFKLSNFLTDIFGVSGRNLMNVLISKGKLSPTDVENETKRISQEKKDEIKVSINGSLTEHQRDFLKLQLSHLDELVSHQTVIEKSIETMAGKFSEKVSKLDTIPGIGFTSAAAIIAEIGTDMSKFPKAENFCSWAGVSPGDNKSAGKKKVLE